MGSLCRPLLVVLSCLVLGCGGSGHAGSTTRPTGLGVQSNVPHREVRLRMHADAPMAFATQLRVELRAEMLGHPLDAAMETLGVRRVAPREDGTLAVEEVDTQSTLSLSMMGRSRSGPTHDGPSETRRYVLGDRGSRVDRPSEASPGSYGLEAALDPLVRALELPQDAVAPGAEWRAEGMVPMSVLDPALRGEAYFQVVQRLDRLEGSGDQQVAVIAFEAVVEGMGEAIAMRIGSVPEGTSPQVAPDPFGGNDPDRGAPAEGADPFAPDPFAPDPFAPDPFATEPYDPYATEPFAPDPFGPDPYGGPGPIPGDPMPGDPEPIPEALGGRVEVRGFYVVAVSDGLARMARAEISGHARMGPGALLLVPFEAELDWSATPIDADIVIAPTPSSEPAAPDPLASDPLAPDLLAPPTE